jgi:cyclophilin family peptidyl-prolyl cis-trans isomerase
MVYTCRTLQDIIVEQSITDALETGEDKNKTSFSHLVIAWGTAGKHTIFGRICRGMEVLKRLGNVQTDKQDRLVCALPTSFMEMRLMSKRFLLIKCDSGNICREL